MAQTRSYPTIYAGDSLTLTITVYVDGLPKDLTSIASATYSWMKDGSAAFTAKTLSSGLVRTAGAGGIITASVAFGDTATLAAGFYNSYLTIREGTGSAATDQITTVYEQTIEVRTRI